AGAFVFARLSGGALPWFLFYAVSSLLLAAWLWTRNLLYNLACRWDIPANSLTVGETSEVRLRLYNESWLPATWLEATHQAALGQGTSLAGTVPPLGSLVLTLPVVAARRGFFPAGRLDITLGDPLGIFAAHRLLVSDRRLTVYPRALRLDRLPLALRQPYGHTRTHRHAQEDLTSVAEVRPWRTGDSPRRIHWKATAHRGDLQVREYELSATTEVHVVLDLCRLGHHGDGPDSSLERSVEVAASLVRTILEQGLAVGVAGHGSQRLVVPPGRGLRQLRRVLESLVTVQADGVLPLPHALAGESRSFSPRSTVVVVTPALGRDLVASLLALRGEGHGLLVTAVRPGGPAGDEWEAAAAALQAEAVPTLVVHEASDLLPRPLSRLGVMA
ncbi:MAG: DUF58 domain-containing protein, partial [Bacillota bacterium]